MLTKCLDRTTWDTFLDANGNVAVASEPYSIAQDAASAIRTFRGEVYYDTTQGIPYFAQVLGHAPPASLVKSYLTEAALTVPGAVTAKAFLGSVVGRKLVGQVQITDANGVTITATTG